MKNSEIIKEIRSRLGLSQTEFADKIGISFATVNRWEKDRSHPSQIALNAVKNLCARNHIDFAEFENNPMIHSEEVITLYHGSKSGLNGHIQPLSRDRCDFGKGFYMGTDETQPLTLVCNYPHPKLYTVKVDLSGLNVLDIKVGIDWAMLVAFNRGKMEPAKGTPLYQKYESMTKKCDMVIGFIANDRMFVVLDRFFNGEITDIALINSLSALKLGRQYVALSEKACSQIEILKEHILTEKELQKLKIDSEQNRKDGVALADEICRKYRRDGRFFDEIIKAGE